LVLADGDQVLAAEPGFHSDPPRGGGFEVSAVRRISDHRSELGEQQPENGMALAFGPAQALGVVMKDGAGGAAADRINSLGSHSGFRAIVVRQTKPVQ
jgi:hypothetical protein